MHYIPMESLCNLFTSLENMYEKIVTTNGAWVQVENGLYGKGTSNHQNKHCE
jgi:hypothetical protein